MIKDGAIKLIGFGHAKYENEPHHKSETHLSNYWRWMAPECHLSNSCSSASDVYSYGCVIFEILRTFDNPFSEMENKKQLVQAFRKAQACLWKRNGIDIDVKIHDKICRMDIGLFKNEKFQPTKLYEDVLATAKTNSHKYVTTKLKSLSERSTRLNPDNRFYFFEIEQELQSLEMHLNHQQLAYVPLSCPSVTAQSSTILSVVSIIIKLNAKVTLLYFDQALYF